MAILFVAGFTSCQKIADGIEDSVEVTITTEMEAPFVAVPNDAKANGDTTYFDVTTTLDPNENDDLADYLDKVKNLDVLGVFLEVTSISSEDLILHEGRFSFTDNKTNQTFEFDTQADTPIKAGTMIEIGESYEHWDVITTAMKEFHPATIAAHGAINNENFEVEFIYGVRVKVTAGR